MDFSHQDLKGKSFAHQALNGANFSGSDIRGVDFNNASLSNTNFSDVRAGIPPSRTSALAIGSVILVAISGLVIGYSSAFPAFIANFLAEEKTVWGLLLIPFTLSILVGFFLILVRQGISASLGSLCVIAAMLTAIIALVGSGSSSVIAASVIQAIVIAMIMASVLVESFALSVFLSIGNRKTLIIPRAAAVLTAMLGLREGLQGNASKTQLLAYVSYGLTIVISIALLSLSLYISRRAVASDARYVLIKRAAAALCGSFGTSFKGADLTDSTFAKATLSFTDFRQAILKKVSWAQSTIGLSCRLEGTYLSNHKILNLLISKDGIEQTYDDMNLRDLDLQSANFTDASCLGTDFSGSDVKQSNFTRAKLVKTRLYGTNLTKACLTGACIQDWAISTDTQLGQINCDYIYMHLPTKEDPDPCRKPDNKNESFNAGDFEAFISPIIKTLDLYQQQNIDPRLIAKTYKTVDLFHHDGIDPQAAAIALKQLAEQHPEAGLEVIALEGRGDEKVRLQARVSESADRSQLSVEYFSRYQETAALPYGDLQSLRAVMAEKDQRIKSLEKIVETATKSDKFYVETYYDLGKHSETNIPVRKILILTANPQGTDRDRLDAEVRAIQTGLERAKQRDQFEIISKWAVRPEDLRRALLDYEPQIVQFSGVGFANEGLALENEFGDIQLVSTTALANLFSFFRDTVECVFFNACYSAPQTNAISQHIPYVIGMDHGLGNRAALEFAVGFYDALGAGRSIDDAFKLGCVSLDLEGLPESLAPVLKRRAKTV